MALVTYLDTLSSGMKARIGPGFRLPEQSAYVSGLSAKANLPESNHALWSIARHKFPSELPRLEQPDNQKPFLATVYAHQNSRSRL